MDESKIKESERLLELIELKDKEIKEKIVDMQQQRMKEALRRGKNTNSKKHKRSRKHS